MADKVFLEYKFLFDPSETWSTVHEFDEALAVSFREMGFEAEIIKTIGGQMGGRLLLLRKKEMPIITDRPKNSKTVREQLDNMKGKK